MNDFLIGMSKTAVELYVNEVSRLDMMMSAGSISLVEYANLKQKAYEKSKTMEMLQVEKAYKDGYTKCHYHMIDFATKIQLNNNPKQYYNETYGKH